MGMNVNIIKKIHGVWRAPWITGILSLLMVIFYMMGNKVFDLLVFDKTAILNGEIWRFVTGHFVHYNFSHLFWDLIAFIFIGSVIECKEPRHLLPSFFIGCLIVSLWLFVGEQSLASYCGLSGALNTLVVVAVMIQWNSTREKIYLSVLVFTLLKIIFEFIHHQTIFTGFAAMAVPSSHAAGFVAGVLYLLAYSLGNLHHESHFKFKQGVVN